MYIPLGDETNAVPMGVTIIPTAVTSITPVILVESTIVRGQSAHHTMPYDRPNSSYIQAES